MTSEGLKNVKDLDSDLAVWLVCGTRPCCSSASFEGELTAQPKHSSRTTQGPGFRVSEANSLCLLRFISCKHRDLMPMRLRMHALSGPSHSDLTH